MTEQDIVWQNIAHNNDRTQTTTFIENETIIINNTIHP